MEPVLYWAVSYGTKQKVVVFGFGQAYDILALKADPFLAEIRHVNLRVRVIYSESGAVCAVLSSHVNYSVISYFPLS